MSGDDELQRLYDWRQLIERRRQGSRLDREAWVMAARQLFAPGERDPCHICGKFKGISQAHHVVPLTAQYDRGFKYPDQECVSLCPNHHAIVHLFIHVDGRSMARPAMRARGRTTSALHVDLTDNEFDQMMELVRRSMRSPE
ncbi:hypothetical protein [Bradyrhizobium sp. SSUT77]|uniref:hypothetical protein n=1 Tax=Bradyrhizobium sp. SSUT77 TaxID=3040603 RepID=UPI002449AB4C|nr:hypothetical protein [Bradyrhizobium sp. SSUT77]MDH2341524.1 hypothetical protein [Bradyrhizobium sp. SSUT77]